MNNEERHLIIENIVDRIFLEEEIPETESELEDYLCNNVEFTLQFMKYIDLADGFWYEPESLVYEIAEYLHKELILNEVLCVVEEYNKFHYEDIMGSDKL